MQIEQAERLREYAGQIAQAQRAVGVAAQGAMAAMARCTSALHDVGNDIASTKVLQAMRKAAGK